MKKESEKGREVRWLTDLLLEFFMYSTAILDFPNIFILFLFLIS